MKYAVSSQLAGRHQKGKRVSYTRPSPLLQKKKGWFHDQHSFLKQGGSAVGGDIVVKEVLGSCTRFVELFTSLKVTLLL